MTADRDAEVTKAAEHVKDGIEKQDLSQVIRDLQDDLKQRGAQDKTFEEALTKKLHEQNILPNVNIEGLDENGNLLVSRLDKQTNKTEMAAFDARGQRVEAKLEGRVQQDRQADAGDQEARRPEAKGITRDADGQVTKVEYGSNGKSQEFTRDEKGDIVKVRNEDNEVWNKQKDGSWALEGSNPPVTWKGALYVDGDGNFVKEHGDPPNGRKDVERADGSIISYDGQKVTRTESPDGQLRDFKYDDKGNLSEIRGPGADSMVRNADGTWTRTADGQRQTGDFQVAMDKDGNIGYKDLVGGGFTYERADGSKVNANEKGQITRIEDDKGKVFEFSYDQNGQMVGVKNEYGNWKSENGHDWTNEKGEKWSGKVSVDEQGNYWYESDQGKLTWNRPDGSKLTEQADPRTAERPRDGQQEGGEKPQERAESRPEGQERVTETPEGVKITEYPDGFKVKDYPDGSQVEVNPEGKVTFIKTKPPENYTRHLEYGPDGQISKVKGMDGSTWQQNPPGSNNWVSDDGAVWRGKVAGVDENGNIRYEPERGRPFVLTREGQVVPGRAQGEVTDAHQRHRRGGGDQPQQGDRPQEQPQPQERAAEERKEAPQINPETVYPKKGVYNPIAPPGVGDSKPGQSHDSEHDTGEGNTPIDWRESRTQDNGDGTITHTYEGELEDSGLMPWNWGDTNFSGSEKWTKDGRLLERHAQYDDGVDMKFQTPEGEKEIEGVKQVDTVFNPETGNYDTVITTENGTKYRAETGPDGQVKSFKEVTDEKQSDAPGDTSAKTGQFNPADGNYNPVRPQGIGEMRPGEASSSDKGKGVDWRDSQAETNPDGSTTYRYKGELEDSGFFDWFDTNYEASETIDKDGNVVESHVKYDSPVDQEYIGPNGKKVSIEGVTQVDTVRNKESGNYDTVITTEDGTKYRAETNAEGKVLKLERVTSEVREDQAGDTNAKVENFKGSNGAYNPVRPQGVGEMRPGEASSSDKGAGVDWRETRTETNPDGSKTYQYNGELEDSGLMPWNWGDTNYTGSETVDKDGNLIESHVKYDSAIDQKYVGPDGKEISIEDVTQVDTVRNQNGEYVTTVKNEDGKTWTFVTGPDGKVKRVAIPK